MQSTVHTLKWKVANKRDQMLQFTSIIQKKIQTVQNNNNKTLSTANPSICFYKESLTPQNILFIWTVYEIWSDQTARGYPQCKQTTKSKKHITPTKEKMLHMHFNTNGTQCF